MTIRDAIRRSGIARLDAEVLLSHLYDRPRSWLLAHESEEMERFPEAEFRTAAARRKSGEPVAYITGEKEFYGRTFAVSKGVLIPRPSTETLIGEALLFLKKPEAKVTEADTGIVILSKPLRSMVPEIIVDVGTGSGIIAITLLKEGFGGGMTAVDISESAIAAATANAERHGTVDRIEFVHGDATEVIGETAKPFLIVSNPPYIPSDENLEKGVRDFEPHEALFAGSEGLDVIIPLIKAAKANPRCSGVVLELRSDQIDAVRELLG